MITVQAQANTDKLLKTLGKDFAKQFPFATALALTNLAQRVRKAEMSVMMARIDRPTRWTQGALFSTSATKRSLSARVAFKQDAPKGQAAGVYLMNQVHGGARRHKAFEKALIGRGYMRKNEFVVPGSAAKLDASGNFPRGTLTKIISGLGAGGEQGYSSNATQSKRSQRKGNAQRYFVAEIDGVRAVWERSSKMRTAWGQGVKPLLIFQTRAPTYRKRFPFFQVAENTLAKWYVPELTHALDWATRNTKP